MPEGSGTGRHRKVCLSRWYLSVRNRAPPPPQGTPLQERPTWLGPPSAPPPEKEEEDQQRRQDRWDRRERAMECTRKNAHQGSGEIREEKREDPSGNQRIVHSSLRFGEETIGIVSFAENARTNEIQQVCSDRIEPSHLK